MRTQNQYIHHLSTDKNLSKPAAFLSVIFFLLFFFPTGGGGGDEGYLVWGLPNTIFSQRTRMGI